MNTPIATEWEGVADIPLWEITEDARNFYETEGSEDIERKNAELMDSIRSDGLMHPIVLRKNQGYRYNERTQDLTPRYVIVSGHRRFIAYQRSRTRKTTTRKIISNGKKFRRRMSRRAVICRRV